MPFADVTLQNLPADAAEARQAEWRLAAAELLEDHVVTAAADGAILVVRVDNGGAHLSLGAPVAGLEAAIAKADIAKHVSEYVGICLRMAELDEGIASPQLEALDMGKKLAHDDAAKTILRLTAPFGFDHATARRLFTLLFTLGVDTTNLRTWHLGHKARRGA